MTAVGADPDAGMKYAKIIGEKRKGCRIRQVRLPWRLAPAVFLGNANTPSFLNYATPLLDSGMPSNYRSIYKNDLSRARWWRSRSRRSSRSSSETLPRRQP
jgi:hypothetical protein